MQNIAAMHWPFTHYFAHGIFQPPLPFDFVVRHGARRGDRDEAQGRPRHRSARRKPGAPRRPQPLWIARSGRSLGVLERCTVSLRRRPPRVGAGWRDTDGRLFGQQPHRRRLTLDSPRILARACDVSGIADNAAMASGGQADHDEVELSLSVGRSTMRSARAQCAGPRRVPNVLGGSQKIHPDGPCPRLAASGSIKTKTDRIAIRAYRARRE